MESCEDIDYFACEYDADEVKPLLDFGYHFYDYLQKDPELWKEFSKNMNPAEKNHNKGYLNRNYSKGHDELHTTMFFGRNPEDREAYERRPEVQQALNQRFKLDIYGLFITPNTMGFRIALPQETLSLWSENDKTKPLHEPICSDIDKFGHCTVTDPASMFVPSNFSRGSRAHATVLTSDLSHPVQTGFDLVDIEYCENQCQKNPHYRDVNLDNGWNTKMRYYGFGRFVFYFNKWKPVWSTFRKVVIK